MKPATFSTSRSARLIVPLLAGLISYVLGDRVTLVSSADECARETYQTLPDLDLVGDLPRTASRQFLTTGDPASVSNKATQFLRRKISFEAV